MTEDKRNELHKRVTDQVLALMAEHGTDWTKPWIAKMSSTAGFHHNHVSGHEFTGWNPFVLAITCCATGWNDTRWATFKQWKQKGCMVRKGSKGTTLLRPLFKSVDKTNPKTGETKREQAVIGWAGYAVFNAEQVDGVEPLPTADEAATPEFVGPDRWIDVLRFVNGTGADIRHGDSAAYYRPRADYIGMPDRDSFEDDGFYFGTLLHELTHWTGHDSRCDRGLMSNASREEYAKEELVAELGAAFLNVEFGIENEPREDHAKYLNNWIAVLKDDPGHIAIAATKATRAVKFLHSLQAADETAKAA